MHPDQVYQLLRNLTSPVVAITAERAGKRNGMIADSAVRASIVPALPRVSVYIHKFNYSHDMIFDSGRFVLHLLRDDQFELIRRLGFASGSGKTALKRRSVRLAKLVHDLNASLRAVPGLQAGRLVRFRKKQRRYALTGARATVVRAARP